jgi:predicted dehydrogenase/threonine dehydrogenase-like Zn-dependent dehydrogenase
MKQVFIRKGEVYPADVPAPMVSRGAVLIRVRSSCISTGTELTSLAGSRKSMLQRALEKPEKMKQAWDMLSRDGLLRTAAFVAERAATETPIGYSLAGDVIAVGEGVDSIRAGDRVAAAGGSANHAEVVSVPVRLVIPIPPALDCRQASTAALGGIAIQSVRRSATQLGEYVVVYGAGGIGQIVSQILKAAGARVVVADVDDSRLAMAERLGADFIFNTAKEDAVGAVMHVTGGRGADAVIFCATTGEERALSDAFAMTRQKGRLVMVGMWGNTFKREDVYAKEIDFLISSSYGPGRYDPDYEQKGIDYPYAYVRWTENRNMEEYLRLLQSGKIRIEPLIHAAYPVDDVQKAFDALQGPEKPMIVLLEYPAGFVNAPSKMEERKRERTAVPCKKNDAPIIHVGLVGAGSFATGVHLPNLAELKDKYRIHAICSQTGAKAHSVARRYNAKYATSDYHDILSDPDIDLVMICTRHNLHGAMVLESLEAGKNTFVEKPLCTTMEELNRIKNLYGRADIAEGTMPSGDRPFLMVGFNRRFSPHIREVKRHTDKRINPLFLHYRMNAGYLPPGHWVHTDEGGGRIIGEACHVIDLFSCLVGSPVKSCSSASLSPRTASVSNSDNRSILFEYEDGSVATLEYFAVGSDRLPKECLEVHYDGKSIIVDDYKALRGYGESIRTPHSKAPEKGHREELESLSTFLLEKETHNWPIDLESIFETTALAIELSST